MQQANSVGLSENYASKVRNGTIDIETITDEDLKDKIDDYQTWYEKALDAKDAIEELKETEAELYQQRFDNVATEYDSILGSFEHEKSMLEEYINQSETQGFITSTKYYDALAANEKDTISKLKEEKNKLLSELQTSMSSGTIDKYSESWYEMTNQIDEVTLAIEESNTALLEYSNNIRDINWQLFDLLQDRISNITSEADFLIDLMDNDKLYDDRGQLTNEGLSTMGLHGVNYNVYMAQADKYAKEIENLNKEISKDPYDQDLIDRRQELIELQQESIINAEDEKNAIKDMVEEGIQLELDALQELIDKRNEALDAAKDQYEYQNDIAEKTAEIAELEKQIGAYAGDDSEETKSKVQELKVSLEEARQDLEESEYDQYISDQKQLLDELYLEYETILNTRLDNIDMLMSDMIVEINSSSSMISTTLSQKADEVGYTLSQSMSSIWDTNATGIKNVITTYGDKFNTALTTTNSALQAINTNIQNMVTYLNKKATTNINSSSTSSSTSSSQANTSVKKPSTTTTKPAQTQKTVSVGSTINAGGATIYATSYGGGGGRQYFASDPIYVVIGENNGYWKVRWHGISSGVTGWFKKGDVKAYATGKKKILSDEFAWTQENGSEMIVRPSDGAILTPLANGDSVLNSYATNNIWNMANNPSGFIRENLNTGGVAESPVKSSVSSYTQNIDSVVFSMPNVKNYDEMLKAMQKDKNFENLVLAMTIDQIAGGSSLSKGKAIR